MHNGHCEWGYTNRGRASYIVTSREPGKIFCRVPLAIPGIRASDDFNYGFFQSNC